VKLSSSILYRIASVLLLLFAAGHTLGFGATKPEWGVDALISSMRTIHFDVQGFSRSYWDLFVGFGLFVTVFLLFAAVLAWQLGGASRETLHHLSGVTWSLAITFVGITIVCCMYIFMVPIIFAAVITLCLILAAWSAGK
jgi:hypothetical protein